MGGPIAAPQVPELSVGADRNFAISFDKLLDVGELLINTPTIAEITTSDLIFTNQGISTAELKINDGKVATARAVQFNASGFLDGVRYQVKITVNTDATPAQTLVRTIFFITRPDS